MRRLLSLFVVLVGLLSAPVGHAQPEHGAPSAQVGPNASTSGSASAPEAVTTGVVRLKDRKVFTLSTASEGKSPLERARHASHALERAFDARDSGDAHFERHGEVAVVFVGKAPIVELTEADATAASAATLDVLAADAAAKVQTALNEERKRSAIANSVFSFSLIVFTGLVVFLLFGKVSQIGSRARLWIEENPDRIPSLRFGGVELMRPAAFEAVLGLVISIVKRVVQLGVLYAWVIFALSLFDSTRGYTDKLTALVLGPISGFIARVGSGLPLAVVMILAVLATALLVRFTGVFFAGVARGETSVDWVPQDLAAHVGVIDRIGLVVAALVLAAPLLTGSEEGALARAGVVTLIAFGLASTPVIACGIVGAIVVFNRRLHVGEFIELGGRTGRVRDVTLLEVVIEDESGCIVRIPHVLSLLRPTRLMGASPVVAVELCVDPKAPQVRVRDVLNDAVAKVGTFVRVELTSIDADGALYRVVVGVGPQLLAPIVAPLSRRTRSSSGERTTLPGPIAAPRIMTLGGVGDSLPGGALGAASNVQLTSLLADALAKEGIGLGRRSFLPVRSPS